MKSDKRSASMPSSSSSTSTSQRVAAHTHISGLGLNEYGEVDNSDNNNNNTKCGLIGQVPAREAMGLIADLVQVQKLAGRAALLTGPPGSGKTALAVALSKTIGEKN
jgi:RuvB-like protein 1